MPNPEGSVDLYRPKFNPDGGSDGKDTSFVAHLAVMFLRYVPASERQP